MPEEVIRHHAVEKSPQYPDGKIFFTASETAAANAKQELHDSLPEQKNRRIAELHILKQGNVGGGFTYNNKKLHTDEKALVWLNGMYNRIIVKQLPDATPLTFVSREGDSYKITVGVFKTVYTALTDYLADVEEYGSDLEDTIIAAVDQAAFDAIDITVGWP